MDDECPVAGERNKRSGWRRLFGVVNHKRENSAPARYSTNHDKYSGRYYASTTVSDNAQVVQGDVVHNYYQMVPSEQLKEQNEKPSSRQRKDSQGKLVKSLAYERMHARLWNIDKALPDTCLWLQRHHVYTTWIDESRRKETYGFLWIKGKPGCGKSTIMKVLYETAKRTWTDEVSVSYFFNGRAPGKLEKSSLGVYRSLTHQLLSALPHAKDSFVAKFTSKELASAMENWTSTELKDSLIEIITNTGNTPVNIFIDALDEGDKESDIRQMVDFIDNLAVHALSSNSKLRVCLSSRHYPHISIPRGLSIILEDQVEHAADIKAYTDCAFRWDEEGSMMQELREEVCKKSAGVFLWVILVIPMLNAAYDRGGSVTAMKELLQSLPSELDALFGEILVKSSENLEDCVHLLQWVLFSTRPLTAPELYIAIQNMSKTGTPMVTDCPDHIRLKKFLLHCSRGLVEITKFRPYSVQFIHETVRSFLLSPRGLGSIAPSLLANLEGLSHESLRSVCFQYVTRIPRRRSSTALGYENELEREQMKDPIFLSYAVDSMLSHADEAQRSGISQQSFLLHLKNNNMNDFAKWCNLHDTFKHDYFRSYAMRVPLIYVLAEQNFAHLVRCLCEQGLVDVNASGGQRGYALHAACAEGNDEIVQLLLANGAEINVPGGVHECTPLSEACANSRLDSVNLLLKHGADPNMAAGNYGFALQAASSQSDTALAKLLLAANANVNAQGGNFNTALQAAAFFGYEAIVKILIEAGADVSLRGGEYHSALHAASFSTQTGIIRTLLEAGADIDIQQPDAETPLQVVAAAGNQNMTSFLLNIGADPNVQGGEYGNALQAASFNGYEHIVRILVRGKADVNRKGGKYGSALQAAAFSDHIKIVKDLVHCKADINSGGGAYGSAIHAAASAGNTDVVHFLICAGADMNACQEPYGTPLQAAAFWGKIDVVSKLLRTGAEWPQRYGQLGKAIQIARSQGHQDIVRLICKQFPNANNALKDAEDGENGTQRKGWQLPKGDESFLAWRV